MRLEKTVPDSILTPDRTDKLTALKTTLESSERALNLETSCLAGEIPSQLQIARLDIGLSDVCIAATALQMGLTLVTSNLHHFPRVQTVGFLLNLDNWRESNRLI